MKKKLRENRLTVPSRVLLGIGLGLALLAVWQIFFVAHDTVPMFWPWSAMFHSNMPELQYPPLLAVGISLGHADQQPALSKEQAMFIANQLRPDAAAQAKQIEARYVLLDYRAEPASTASASFQDVPTWLVWYQKIPLQATSALVDPTPFPQSYHDLYLFLDDSTGHELLSVWA